MCIFCDIVTGRQKVDLVYQDRAVIAFRDIKPKARVHILVVPRKHIVSLQALGKEDLVLAGKMILAVQKIIQQEKIASSFKVVINGGRLQEVKHLHLHILSDSS